MTRRLAVVSAGLSQPSSSRLLADRLAEASRRHLAESEGIALGDVEVTVVELRDLAHDITNNLLTGFPAPALRSALDAVTGADALIVVTPIFTTSYSGLFKSFVDILDPGSITDLPVLLGATGGTERHSLAIDYAVRPLFAYLRAALVPTGVYAASRDWGDTDAAGALSDRIDRAAGELAAAVRVSRREGGIRDPFELPAGFSPF